MVKPNAARVVVLDETVDDSQLHELDAVGHQVQTSVVVLLLLLLDQDHHEFVDDRVVEVIVVGLDENSWIGDEKVRQIYVVGTMTAGGVVGEPFGRMAMSEQPINVSFSRPSPGPDWPVVGSVPQLFAAVYFH